MQRCVVPWGQVSGGTDYRLLSSVIQPRVTVDAYAGFGFHGKVTEIRKAPINVQNVITYDSVIAVSNPDLKLFPGMTANVKVLVDHRSGVLKIPNAALRFRPATSAAQKTAAPGPGSRRQAVRSQDVWLSAADGRAKA